jgi:hypothetical protein
MHQAEFNLGAGLQAKKEGMNLAAMNKVAILDYARSIAFRIARNRESKEACIDDVTRVFVQNGGTGKELGKAAGSVFQKEHWVFTGRWERSPRRSNHARENKVWRLRAY